MDNYHIYEELGRGKNSIVYKGRRKKSIEYVAVKCVEKGMMEKVLNEVQIMHRLDCEHTLRFHAWYETRNHIWMVVEYCAGGNLLTVLQQDLCMPELSARVFGFDVIAGLHYLHTLGVIFCDLKPSNLLLNEFAVLKLANFRLARRVPTRQNAERTAQMKRGTPCYMAPELFASVSNFVARSVSSGMRSISLVVCYRIPSTVLRPTSGRSAVFCLSSPQAVPPLFRIASSGWLTRF